MRCIKCGKEIEKDMAFCGNCGAPVHTADQSAVQAESPVDNKITGKKKGLIIAAIMLLVAVGTAAVFLWRNIGVTNAFSNDLEAFEDHCAEYQLGDLEKEYKELVEKANTLIESKDSEEYGQMKEQFDVFKEKLNEYIKAVGEYGGKEEEYRARFEMLALTGDQLEELEVLIAELRNGMADASLSRIEQALTALEADWNECKTENVQRIEELKTEIDSFSAVPLLGAEQEILGQHLSKVENSLNDNDYQEAIAEYDKAVMLYKNAQMAQNFNMEVQQVETSSFPNIKLYVSAYQPQTGTRVEILDDLLELRELVEGSYQEIEIEKVSKLNQAEGLNVCLVADVSGSMYEQIDIVKEAMTGFLDCMQYNVGDKAALITFDNFVNMNYGFTADKNALANEINNIYVGNSTALYDALYVAVCDTSRVEGAKCVIAFTDGYDNVSTKTKRDVIEAAELYGIPVYLIGLGSGVDDASLKEISNATGGYYLNLYDGSRMQEVYNSIYKEKKELYLIEYTTSLSDVNALQNLYLSYHNGDTYMRCEANFQPSQLQASEEEYESLVQVDGIANEDIEDEVLRIRGIYNEIVRNRDNGVYTESVLEDGVTAYLENGHVRCVIVRKGVKGNQYRRFYYYENDKLIFAYIEAADAHRLYFKNEKIFRWRYASNAVKFTEAENHDNEDSAEFRTWGTFALDEANGYKAMIR